ncbi:MAG: DegV family protein [Candidatus Heimdallarchaeota archaeon]|nr:DegV family protein [Candidatus Heimdallarchaeota archaeon]MCK5049013.1 DegV family protein [Candidatus Heimdallarchaeota archaeon]
MASKKAAYAIVTDSTSDISLEDAKEMNITIVPAWVIINGEEYKDQIDITKEEFFELAKKVDGKVPRLSTSTPSAGEFYEYFEELAKENEEILAIHLTSKLSGLYQTSVLGASMVKDRNIKHVDSLSVSWGLGFLVKIAVHMRSEGKSIDETIELLEKMKKKVQVLAIFHDLSYAKAGGRLSTLKYYFGRFLQLLPIIEVKDGTITTGGATRSMKRGVEKMIEKIIKNSTKEEKVWIAVGHSGVEELKDWLKEKFLNEMNVEFMKEFFLGSVLGAHIGPGAIGVFMVPNWKTFENQE